jgi:hypothetical protein
MKNYKSLKQYYTDLELALEGADPAIVADALDDAEEFLEENMTEQISSGDAPNKKEAARKACEAYGEPEDVAKEYLKQDKSWKKKEKKKEAPKEGLLKSTFGVYLKGRTYANMLYLFLMFPLGILYFTYIVTGISTCAGLIVTVVGIPLGVLFLLSFIYIGWFHGRMTEVLLGIRMPKKRRKMHATGTAWQRFKTAMKNPRLYSTVLYLFLMFPLGIFYFCVLVTFLSVALALICAPLLYVISESIDIQVGLPAPLWFQVLLTLLGFVMLTWTMHLSNIMAGLHGKLTVALLLRR